jgi:hypothetical protein
MHYLHSGGGNVRKSGLFGGHCISGLLSLIFCPINIYLPPSFQHGILP